MAIVSGTSGTCSWDIDNNGKLTIKPTSGSSGDLQIEDTYFRLNGADFPWYNYREQIKSIVLSGSIKTTYTFFGTTKSGNFSYMFEGCSNLIEISGLNSITGAEDISYMFYGCNLLKTIDISSLNITNVTNMNGLFAYCSSLISITGIKSTNKLKKASYMFSCCKSLISLDLTNLNTTNCDTLNSIFNGTPLLSTIKMGDYFYVKPFSQYTSGESTDPSAIDINSAKNITNGIIISSDEAFSELTNTQRKGTWQHNVSFTYDVSAYRSTSGVKDEDGGNVSFDILWATNVSTTDRIIKIYQKEARAASYPSSPVLTQNLSGNSGNTTLTINNIGDNAYDFKVEFYDGTDTYLAFPSIQTNIRLITIDETGNVCLALDTAASSGTTDADLYDAINTLGWTGDVLTT